MPQLARERFLPGLRDRDRTRVTDWQEQVGRDTSEPLARGEMPSRPEIDWKLARATANVAEVDSVSLLTHWGLV
jgi:hypothetical protein